MCNENAPLVNHDEFFPSLWFSALIFLFYQLLSFSFSLHIHRSVHPDSFELSDQNNQFIGFSMPVFFKQKSSLPLKVQAHANL